MSLTTVNKTVDNANSEQNGRHVPARAVALPSITEPHTVQPSRENAVCRDFVWGICYKHGQCRFRHECSLDEMRTIIKFCHDHQNRTGCLRRNCTYLHTSSEEANLFYTTGTLPRILLERHTAMNAAANTSTGGVSDGYECPPAFFITQPPPPPPPPPPLNATAPTPPPPPPPPPPPTESSIVRTAPTIYTAPPPQAPPTLNQPPPQFIPPIFDASRPPPLYPTTTNGPIKRTNPDSSDPGPSKVRKTEDAKLPDKMCEYCIQRELSSELCMEEVNNLNRQREYKKLLYKTKFQDLENVKTMLRYLLPADSCGAIEEHIDEMQNTPLSLAVPMDLILNRLFEDTISSNMLESMQSSSMRELLLNCLLNISTSSERSPTLETRSNDLVASDILRLSASDDSYRRFVNGQSSTRSTTVTTTPSNVRPVYPSSSSGVSRAYLPVAPAPVPGPSTAPPAPLYPPPFQPAVPPPPPVRHAYSPAYAPPPPVGVSTPFVGAPRAAPPQPQPQPLPPPQPQPPAPAHHPAPPAHHPAPPAPNNYNQYVMGYHSPHYYPPFQ